MNPELSELNFVESGVWSVDLAAVRTIRQYKSNQISILTRQTGTNSLLLGESGPPLCYKAT